MRVRVIAAMSRNRVIGKGGALPWRLPADLRRFKHLTTGHPVIMGRRTYDSIGRPLPDRETIIISRDPGFRPAGAVVVASLDAALEHAALEQATLEHAAGAGDVFIAGGGQIYELALPGTDRLDLTIVHATVDGDTFFPAIEPADWTLADDERFEADDRHEYGYSFRTYLRVRHPGAVTRRLRPGS